MLVVQNKETLLEEKTNVKTAASCAHALYMRKTTGNTITFFAA